MSYSPQIYNLVVATLLASASAMAFADAPPPPPAAYRACNERFTYCADLIPAKKTLVYKLGDQFEPKLAYTIDGWYRNFYLSNNGEFAATASTGSPGVVWWQHDKSTEAFRFWRNGGLWMAITLGEILDQLPVPKGSVSHSFFAIDVRFASGSENSFYFFTRENNCVDVDLPSKKISRRKCYGDTDRWAQRTWQFR